MPVYRCEMCGGILFKDDCDISTDGLGVLLRDPLVIEYGRTPKRIIHECEPGSVGVANIIGIISRDVVSEKTSDIFSFDNTETKTQELKN